MKPYILILMLGAAAQALPLQNQSTTHNIPDVILISNMDGQATRSNLPRYKEGIPHGNALQLQTKVLMLRKGPRAVMTIIRQLRYALHEVLLDRRDKFQVVEVSCQDWSAVVIVIL
jgi:hypothetical protein